MRSRLRIDPWTAALAATLGLASQARADGFALDRFQPAPAGDAMFGVPSPYAAGDGALHLALLAEYAKDPLVVRTEDGNADKGSIVSGQLLLHLDAALALADRFTLSADAPFAFQWGDSASIGGSTAASPSGAAIGDFRLGARATLYGGYFDVLQVALGSYLWLPTGQKSAYAGDGSFRGEPQLILGGRVDRLIWSFAAGPELRASTKFYNVEQGTSLDLGGGAALLLGPDRRLAVGPELLSSVVFGDVQQRTTHLEALLGGRYRARDVVFGLALGPGLSAGVGTPALRAVGMVAYSPEVIVKVLDRDRDGVADAADACPDTPGLRSADPAKNGCPPADADRDGIVDAEDACPDVPGVRDPDPKKNGCPPVVDTDGDGIVDRADACPTVPGVLDPDPSKNGCPPSDRDGDRIVDAADACPDLPGVLDADPAKNGCPPDTDGDGIRDDQDACKLEKGKPDPDPEKNGCPVAVRVTETEIVILQQVQFDTGKATIRKESDMLLDEVAGVLQDHPEITRIEVQGHTDDRGDHAYNVKLSGDRARSVLKALVRRGVSPDRLRAKGYGPNVPIADNGTPEGRQKNRRVQFQIVDKAPKAAR